MEGEQIVRGPQGLASNLLDAGNYDCVRSLQRSTWTTVILNFIQYLSIYPQLKRLDLVIKLYALSSVSVQLIFVQN